jgi:RNA polymerase sigma-70 factor (ECF subfamily)
VQLLGRERLGDTEDRLTDEEVVDRVLRGEVALFEILMRRHNPRIYRVARSIVKDEEEAEDIMQQAYVNAYTHLSQFAGRARFSTWLTRIAVYEALARARRRQQLEPIDEASGADEDEMTRLVAKQPDPEQQALAGELRVLLESPIDALPEAYRSTFVLREVQGLSITETAECLGINEETVKTRLHRARGRLRETLYRSAGLANALVFPFHYPRCDRVVDAVFARLDLGQPQHRH